MWTKRIEADAGSLFAQLFVGVILANTQKSLPKQRKVVEVGLVKLLSRSDAILTMDKVW